MAPPLPLPPGQRGKILSDILGSISLEQAHIRLDYELAPETIRRLKKGFPTREGTIRAVAVAFWQRVCEVYGEDVTACFGDCNVRTASDWLAALWGYTPAHLSRGTLPPRTEEYDSDLEEIDVAQFRGARGLPAEDVETLNAVIRAFIAEKRRLRGVE
jgi:hypothetical protein